MGLQLDKQQGELLLRLLAREALELKTERKREDHVKELMRQICVKVFHTNFGLLQPK